MMQMLPIKDLDNDKEYIVDQVRPDALQELEVRRKYRESPIKVLACTHSTTAVSGGATQCSASRTWTTTRSMDQAHSMRPA